MSRVQCDRYHPALWHHASPSPTSPLISSFSAYFSHRCLCSQANGWAELMSSSLIYRTKKSWHTLTLICPDPPFNSQSVYSPFVLHLSRADGQVLMLDIPSGHSMCSLELVWSVCIQQKGVSYLCVCLLSDWYWNDLAGWSYHTTWRARRMGNMGTGSHSTVLMKKVIFGCFAPELNSF